MASMTFMTTTLSRLQATKTNLGFISRKQFQAAASKRYCVRATKDEAAEAAKQGREAIIKGLDATKNGGQQLKNEAANAADNATEKAKDMAGTVSSAGQDAAGKVKQTAEGAWGTVKDTTKKIKDTVVNTAEAAAQTVKEEAKKIERNIKD